MDYRDRTYYDDTYIDGNTVRKAQTAPEEIPVRERCREEIKRDRARRLSAKRNQQQALVINLGYVLFLIAATAICCAVCFLFIRLQSDITTHMRSITSLESELSDLRAKNSALENRLETSFTLDQIKARADALGLEYPEAGQVYTYTVPSSDYMNQYGEVTTR